MRTFLSQRLNAKNTTSSPAATSTRRQVDYEQQQQQLQRKSIIANVLKLHRTTKLVGYRDLCEMKKMPTNRKLVDLFESSFFLQSTR